MRTRWPLEPTDSALYLSTSLHHVPQMECEVRNQEQGRVNDTGNPGNPLALPWTGALTTYIDRVVTVSLPLRAER